MRHKGHALIHASHVDALAFEKLKGEHEQAMIRTVIKSGYSGPIGILDHQNELDTKVALERNLKGLETLELQ